MSLKDKWDNPKILWVDLETTGLDPSEDAILEAAFVVTNENLEILYSTERVYYYEGIEEWEDPFVWEMHTKNGLWKEAAKSNVPISQLNEDLNELIASNRLFATDTRRGAVLAGSTVSFDRAFLNAVIDPDIMAMLDYRNIDVSTVTRLMRMWMPKVHERMLEEYPETDVHRALPDVLRSINLLRFAYKHFIIGGVEI